MHPSPRYLFIQDTLTTEASCKPDSEANEDAATPEQDEQYQQTEIQADLTSSNAPDE